MISTGGHLTILESVDSTNNYAMAKVRTGLAKHGDGFFAMAQVKGKGQRGKAWITEPGANIILTLVMQPSPLTLDQQFPFSMAVALGVYDFFSSYAGDETSVKWPNDIYWRDRKAGGILIESIVSSGESIAGRAETVDSQELIINQQLPGDWQWAVAGIGININQTSFPENIRNAVSLKQITGKDWDTITLAKELSQQVENRFQQLITGADLLQEYNAHLFKKGQTVRLKKGSRVFDGVVKEVINTGELIVFTALEERFNFGEIEWVISS